MDRSGKKAKRVLLAGRESGDIEPIVKRLSLIFPDHKFSIVTRGKDVFNAINRQEADILVIEDKLKDTTAEAVCKNLKSRQETSGIHIIVFGPLANDVFCGNILKSGADDILRKPFFLSELIARLKQAFRTLNLTAAVKEKHFPEQPKSVESFSPDIDKLMNSHDDAMLIMSMNGDILYYNPAIAYRLGYSDDELRDLRAEDLIAESDTRHGMAMLENILSGKTKSCTIPLQTSKKEILQVELKVARGRWKNQDVLFGIAETITAEQQIHKTLRKREDVLEAVSYSANHLLGNFEWSQCLMDVLGRLAQATGAVRAYICENVRTLNAVSGFKVLHEWTDRGVQPKFEGDVRMMKYDDSFREYIGLLSADQPVTIRSENISTQLKNHFFMRNLASIVLIPIFTGDDWWGYVGYDYVDSDDVLSDSELEALCTSARIFGTGLHRQQVQLSMQGNLQFLETFLDTIPSPAFYKDANGIYRGCNAAFSQLIVGRPKREILGHCIFDFPESFPPSLAEYFHQKDLALLEKPGYQTFEAAFECTDGIRRTFLFDKTSFLDDQGRVVGICGVMTDITELKMAESELNTARQREINIGFEIQNRLLLTPPPQNLGGAEVAAISIPSHQIDGDFYDFIRYDSTHFDVFIGDVMGKGVSAAMLGAATKTQFLRSVTNLVCSTNLATLPTPEEILAFIHRELSDKLISLNTFVTACCARFYLDKLRMDLVDCGHTKTIHYRSRTNEYQLIKSTNLPLGFLQDEVYTQHSVHLEVGDVLLFYSDGLIETKNSNDDDFGTDRLVRFLADNSELSSQQIVQKLYSELIHFSASVTFSDDLTYVVVKITNPDAKKLLHRRTKSLLSNIENLEPLRIFIDKAIQDLTGADITFISQFELAVSEATSNIIKHAYKRKSDQPIEVELDVYPDYLEINLFHWGDGLDDFQLITPAFDGSQENGYGLYLIRNCVDEVNYSTDQVSGKARVRLAKYFRDSGV